MIQNSCEHKPKEVFRCVLDGIERIFYASDYDNTVSFDKPQCLVLNLTKEPHKTNVYDIDKLMVHMHIMFDEVVLGWRDGDIPPVLSSFWHAFEKYIEYNFYLDICLNCVASHGRTGTALASLMVAIKGVTAEEAINHIRKVHCSKAIETDSQVRYIFEMDNYYNNRQVPDEIDIRGSIMLDLISKYELLGEEDEIEE